MLFAAAFAVRGFAAVDVAAVGFAVGDFAVVDFAAVDFAVRGLRGALDFAAAVRGLDGLPPVCPDRDTRWSDTPVPVPSAASSS